MSTPPQSGHQLSLSSLLLLLLLTAAWFASFQLVEQWHMLALAALLCAVSTLLCRGASGPVTRMAKGFFVVLAWSLLYLFSAGPVIRATQHRVPANVLTTLYPFVEAREVATARGTLVRYRLRGRALVPLREFFDPWWR